MSETEIAATEAETDLEAVPAPRPKASPITSRFLFVDVASRRAKQLRRGALIRLSEEDPEAIHRPVPHKPERIAMEEVRRCLVLYNTPNDPPEESPAL